MSQKMLNQLVYMFFGFIVAVIGLLILWNLSGNIYLAFVGFIAILAFWIGALSVVFRFSHHGL